MQRFSNLNTELNKSCSPSITITFVHSFFQLPSLPGGKYVWGDDGDTSKNLPRPRRRTAEEKEQTKELRNFNIKLVRDGGIGLLFENEDAEPSGRFMDDRVIARVWQRIDGYIIDTNEGKGNWLRSRETRYLWKIFRWKETFTVWDTVDKTTTK